MWRVSTIVPVPIKRAPEKRGSPTLFFFFAACRHLFGSHTKYQAITTGNGGIMSVQVLRRDWTQLRRISCRTWGHDTLWDTGSVWKRVAQNEYRKTKTKTKTPPCTSGTKWCVSNDNMRHTRNTQGRSGHDLNWPAFSYFFVLYICW